MSTFIQVITAPNCPHSPRAVRIAQKIAKEKHGVHFVEVSMITQQGQQMAKNYGISATPSIAINGRVAYVGVPSTKALSRMIDSAVREENEKTNYFY